LLDGPFSGADDRRSGPAVSKWLSGTAKTETVPASESVSVSGPTLTVRPTAALKSELQKQIGAYLAGCVAQDSLTPTDCPFESFGFGTISAVSWTITAQPTVDLTAGSGGKWEISTDSPGSASVTFQDDFFGVTAESDTEPIYIDGVLTFPSGEPKFTYSDGF